MKYVLLVCFLFLAGCGGTPMGGIGVVVHLDPENATVAASGTHVFEVVAVETFAESAQWTVKEAGGGSISPNVSVPPSATYTAPSTPGTYHIRAEVVCSDKTRKLEATVVVQ